MNASVYEGKRSRRALDWFGIPPALGAKHFGRGSALSVWFWIQYGGFWKCPYLGQSDSLVPSTFSEPRQYFGQSILGIPCFDSEYQLAQTLHACALLPTAVVSLLIVHVMVFLFLIR